MALSRRARPPKQMAVDAPNADTRKYRLYFITCVRHRFIMEKVLELIAKKKEEYRKFKGEMRHDMNVAKKLGFDTQALKIGIDHTWANEILELLEEIAVEAQQSSNGG